MNEIILKQKITKHMLFLIAYIISIILYTAIIQKIYEDSAYLIEAIGPFIIIEFLAFFICQFLPKISNIIFNFKPIHIILLSVSIKIIVILESLIYYQIEKIFFRIFKFQIAPSISLIFIYIFFLYCLLIFFSIRFICYSIKKIKKINLLEKYECSDCSFRIAYFDSNCKNCNEKLV